MVELIPKKREQMFTLPPWMAFLFPVAVIVFLLSLGAWGGLIYLKKVAEKELDLTEQKINEARSPERQALEAELLETKRRIENIAGLLKDHPKLTKIFEKIEETTHPLVWFSEFSFDREKLSVRMSAQAEDFVALAQQQELFEKSDFIDTVNISEISLGEDGRVNFVVDLLFNSNVFK